MNCQPLMATSCRTKQTLPLPVWHSSEQCTAARAAHLAAVTAGAAAAAVVSLVLLSCHTTCGHRSPQLPQAAAAAGAVQQMQELLASSLLGTVWEGWWQEQQQQQPGAILTWVSRRSGLFSDAACVILLNDLLPCRLQPCIINPSMCEEK